MKDTSDEDITKKVEKLHKRIDELEITGEERRRAYDRINHLNLVISSVRNVNQLITKEKDRDLLLQDACDILIENRGYFTAWIILLDETGRPVTFAQSGLDKKLKDIDRMMKNEDFPPCFQQTLTQSGVAAFKASTSICAGCYLLSEQKGKGIMLIRLEHEDRIYGFLHVSIPDDYIDDKEERDLLREVADDIAFALHNIEIEKQHRRTQEELERIFNLSIDILCVAGFDGLIKRTNPSFGKILGFSNEELLSQPFINFVHPDDRTDTAAKVAEIAAGLTTKNFDHRFQCKDGNYKWISWNVFPVTEEGLMYAAGRDITELRKAEEKLRFLSSFVEQSSEGMAVADLEGCIIFANQAWARMHDYVSGEELAGEHLAIFCSQEQMQREVIPFNSRVMEMGFNTGEVGHIRRDGAPFPTLMTATALKNERGEVYAMAAIARDITESAQFLKQLEDKACELEKTNAELKETTGQLVQSEKLSALGELAAGVAHELNQPLNGIKIICQSILRDIQKNRLDMADLEHDLNDSVLQVNKMAQIIDHMRIFTRYSEVTHNENFDINTSVEGPFKLLEQQLKNHNIEITRELCPDLPKVRGNPIRLEQVFMNLITNAKNAVETSGKEKKSIEIKTFIVNSRNSPVNGDAVAAEIKDNGTGISDHIKNKIFQPFFTTREPGKGTGLGLSVSNKIIEEHSGKIELNTKIGEGTTFRVIIPIARQ